MNGPSQLCDVLRIKTIAAYLDSDPRRTAQALENLADGGYAIRVNINPDRWVRVVPVEVEIMGGVAWTPRYPAAAAKVAQ